MLKLEHSLNIRNIPELALKLQGNYLLLGALKGNYFLSFLNIPFRVSYLYYI